MSAARTRISSPKPTATWPSAIARQLGNSVEKVLLYEETARAYDNLRNTQEQLLQSEKMSAVGQLISGVAHELNNPLTAILGYVQLLETEPIGERAQDYVRKLYRQTQRTHRVVQNLLSFSRQRKPIQSQVDLRRVLEDTLALREFDLKLNNILLERNYEPAVPFITGDAHQLEQVFLNIINNAVDAIMDSREERQSEGAHLSRGKPGLRRITRLRPGAQGDQQDFRSVLHHQEDRQGQRPRVVHLLRHREGARRRHPRLQPRTRRRGLPIEAPDCRRAETIRGLGGGSHPAAPRPRPTDVVSLGSLAAAGLLFVERDRREGKIPVG